MASGDLWHQQARAITSSIGTIYLSLFTQKALMTPLMANIHLQKIIPVPILRNHQFGSPRSSRVGSALIETELMD
jgi:hypothetical protein